MFIVALPDYRLQSGVFAVNSEAAAAAAYYSFNNHRVSSQVI